MQALLFVNTIDRLRGLDTNKKRVLTFSETWA